jgi:hypothetical protein
MWFLAFAFPCSYIQSSNRSSFFFLVRSTIIKSSFLYTFRLSLKKLCTVISERTMFWFQMLHSFTYIELLICQHFTAYYTLQPFTAANYCWNKHKLYKVFLILPFPHVFRWSSHISLYYYKNHAQPQYIQAQQNTDISPTMLCWLPWKFCFICLRPLLSFNCKYLRCYNFKICEQMQIWWHF